MPIIPLFRAFDDAGIEIDMPKLIMEADAVRHWEAMRGCIVDVVGNQCGVNADGT